MQTIFSITWNEDYRPSVPAASTRPPAVQLPWSDPLTREPVGSARRLTGRADMQVVVVVVVVVVVR